MPDRKNPELFSFNVTYQTNPECDVLPLSVSFICALNGKQSLLAGLINTTYDLPIRGIYQLTCTCKPFWQNQQLEIIAGENYEQTIKGLLAQTFVRLIDESCGIPSVKYN